MVTDGRVAVTLTLEGDASGRQTQALFDAMRSSTVLYVEARASLERRAPEPGGMSELMANSIALSAMVASLPGCAVALGQLITRFRRQAPTSGPIRVTGPRGPVEIPAGLSPDRIAAAVNAALTPSAEPSSVADAQRDADAAGAS